MAQDSLQKRGLTSAAAVPCDGPVLESGLAFFPYSGKVSRHFQCIERGGTRDVFLDDAGQSTELSELEAIEAGALKHWHSSLDLALQERVAEMPADAWLNVHVWFHVDEPDTPLSKDDLLVDDPTSGRARDEREGRIRAVARATLTELAGIVGPDGSPRVRTRTNVDAVAEFGAPFVELVVQVDALPSVGALDRVWLVTESPGQGVGTENGTEEHFYVNVEHVLEAGGFDGTGKRAAILEGAWPDTWTNLTGAVTGNCTAGGVSRLCHCPAGYQSSHNRYTSSVIRNGSTPEGGMADDATIIYANWGGGCTTWGPTGFASAANWSTNNGAHVINMSWGFGAGSPQTSNLVFLDYKAVTTPFPLIVTATGNDGNALRPNDSRNGVVVGGADDHMSTNRLDATMTAFSHGANWNGAAGLESPHVVAPAVNIEVADATAGAWVLMTGTSVAAPQVSGMALSLMELNGWLIQRPEAIIVGTLVGADKNVSNVFLSLSDGVDDLDGAGLINAWATSFALDAAAKRDGGNAAVGAGHDYRELVPGTPAAGTYYEEVYNAQVQSGNYLRVASILMARPTCGSPAQPGNCTANPFATHSLEVWDGAQLAASSANSNMNWQYLAYRNTSGATKNYQIKWKPLSWGGLTGGLVYHALAWLQGAMS